MVLELKDHWVWDSWYFKEGNDYHCFFLRASRALIDPERRHLRASIGHAVSKDLKNWNLLPDAIVTSDIPNWDDNATWTGSVVKDEKNLFHLFYTGVRRSEAGLIQRIGHATSKDLITWEKDVASPVTEADAKYYERLNRPDWHDEAWRDPWVFFNPGDKKWHMLITARHKDGPIKERGTVGHAVSNDLKSWEVTEPLSGLTPFGQLEVLQIEKVEDKYVLIFCCATEHMANPGSSDKTGTYSAPADSLLGPFHLDKAQLIAENYAARIVQGPDGTWNLMGFKENLTIGDPIPLQLTAEGNLIPRN